MSQLARMVEEVEKELEEARSTITELSQSISVNQDTISDLQASLNGSAREIDELYDRLQYYESVHPELKTSWEVKTRLTGE
jgi:chromosome segregation ATPase